MTAEEGAKEETGCRSVAGIVVGPKAEFERKCLGKDADGRLE